MTRNGPLIENHFHIFSHFVVYAFPIKLQTPFSLKWVGFAQKDFTSHIDLFKINNAKTAKEILEIGKKSKGIALNIGFTDSQGNIGLVPLGSYVKRKHPLHGQTISHGWTDENEWERFIDPDEKPYLYNPRKKYVVAANNVMTSFNIGTPVASTVPSSARATRITKLIQKKITEGANAKD